MFEVKKKEILGHAQEGEYGLTQLCGRRGNI